ncbi:cobalamin biosynthesis protein [Acidisoma cellulosilytica]|uniref:Cobalamin biosynthesis protein n=1 Tax=Acidisoma cellulosilyticum TaxID=2802395 RepID=A0A963Z0K9_9PROT|nr:cobalamin biosynthesis protein [Acidisoma cellulosilyticum]MCB8879807.1 cobalamin biosynthesis protein [Acidisoma cellulosilyticum]
MIVAGIGCRTGISAQAIIQVLEDAADLGFDKPDLLAVPEFRNGEAGILEAAQTLGLPILWIAKSDLKGEQGRCLTRSRRAEAEVGLASVAEAAALAAAGPSGRLVLPRISAGGVTCALAEGKVH